MNVDLMKSPYFIGDFRIFWQMMWVLGLPQLYVDHPKSVVGKRKIASAGFFRPAAPTPKISNKLLKHAEICCVRGLMFDQCAWLWSTRCPINQLYGVDNRYICARADLHHTANISSSDDLR